MTLTGPFTVVRRPGHRRACPVTATLAPGESITCTATYTVTQADLDAGSVTNIATRQRHGDRRPRPPTAMTITAIQTRDLTLDKTLGRHDLRAVGDVIGYSFEVTNSGNVTLDGPFTVADDQATVELPGRPATPGARRVHHLHRDLHRHPGRPRRGLGHQHRHGAGSSARPTVAEHRQRRRSPPSRPRADHRQDLGRRRRPTTRSATSSTTAIELTNSGNVTLTGRSPCRDDQATVEPARRHGHASPRARPSPAPRPTPSPRPTSTPARHQHRHAPAAAPTVTSNTDTRRHRRPELAHLTIVKEGTSTRVDGYAGRATRRPHQLHLRVTNTGNVTLTGVTVSDPSVTVTCPAGTGDARSG